MTPPDHVDLHSARLPAPAPDALASSDALVESITGEIKACGGAIAFDRFMEMALYEPGLGYYVAGAHKFGSGGDFVTAPELGQLFGRTLAVQVCDVLHKLADDGDANVLEFGAGTGALATTLLSALDQIEALPAHYFIVEPSPELQLRQREAVADLPERIGQRVQWLDVLPESFRGVVVANEVVDAMPVSRYRCHGDAVQEQHVVTTAQDELAFAWQNCDNVPDTVATLVHEHSLTQDYEIEVNARGDAWINALASMLKQGVVLLVDYGFAAGEYYLPERVAGTLRCHYRHFAHDDALFLPGLQDITCHVDFTRVATAADAAGLDVLGFSSQGAFLLSLGLLDLAEGEHGEDVAANAVLAKEVMTLTGPNAMGETFKVMALGKGVDDPLAGFAMSDRRARL